MITKSIVVVLGMHRSGTSAITRGLKTIGIDLGDNLSDSGQEPSADNPKGFWEDRDINSINIDLLKEINHEWDSLPLLEEADFQKRSLENLRLRAAEVLKDKTEKHRPFGIKDPRISRLLPFWKGVFNQLEFSTGYVIVYRHPMSVMKSLQGRNGFAPEKCYYLWLGHMVPCVLDIQGAPRVVVNYDSLMDDPPTQIRRIAGALGLAGDPIPEDFKEFNENFLENRLRHTRYSLEDLKSSPDVPADVIRACRLIEAAAQDAISIESTEMHDAFQQFARNMNSISPALRYMTRCDERIAAAVAERNAARAERDASVAVRDVVASERDAAVQQRDAAVKQLDAAAEQLDVAVKQHNAAVEQRDLAVEQRNAALAEVSKIKNSKAFRFAHRLTAAKWIILNRRLSDHDRMRIRETLRGAYHQLPAAIRNSLRWGYTKFLRNPSQAVQRYRLSTVPFQPPAILPRQKSTGLSDYLFWGVIDWHFRHQRPQHLAQNLALTGRRVFYISAVLLDDDRPGFEVEALDDSGSLFQAKLYARGGGSIYASAADDALNAQLRGSAGELLLWASCRELISFVQHPFWYHVGAALPNCRVVYDCMDYHEGFGNIASEIIALEQDLLRTADLTVTSSKLLDQMASDRTAQRALVRNAADFEHFSNPPTTTYHDERGRRVIGYYGAIAEWFDLELVAAVAKKFRECCLVLVGSDTVRAKSKLGRLPNVKFIGEVPYRELPYYLYGFDVCILPFKVMPLTRATNPVKVYEYLSAGRQVVSIDLPEMEQFGDLVRVANNHSDFISAVDAALNQEPDPDAVRKRQAFAKEQTWTHRVDTLISHTETNVKDPAVSVIVVAYNNMEVTQACLASLGENSDYGALEVIVVDNASTDGTQMFLKEWATVGRNRRIVLNADNKGFAAANNQGLGIAAGEYLVLLNNDTYVTPGWVRTLMNHLRRDRTIGLIGPVTNNIGNEAKIDIEYPNMEAMLTVSSNYTLRHIGKTFPLRTAAFFCVMMRREVYERVGPLDEAFGIGFFEDDDYCRRIEQLGLRIACAEDVFVHHQLSSSFNKLKDRERQALFAKNKALYETKWGKWVPHVYRESGRTGPAAFLGFEHIIGRCNVCGRKARFFFKEVALWRESLVCEHCRSTSRYRSIARGVLRAIGESSGCQVPSLAELTRNGTRKRLRIYDTQPPFYSDGCSYPLPDLLKAAGWIDLELSFFKPQRKLGEKLARGISNQNLEKLTFADAAFDVVITSDVMEHVRQDFIAHREIHRVLRPGGIYLFTVPHSRERQDTLMRVQVVDPADPSKDVHLLEPEYHGDSNSDSGEKALSYRVYGRDLEETLATLGFEVEYSAEDHPENGILNTELYYCRKV
jgi:GT2 family glycosyltransferase/glycosyltransferase involved in cell wall biosynthesis